MPQLKRPTWRKNGSLFVYDSMSHHRILENAFAEVKNDGLVNYDANQTNQSLRFGLFHIGWTVNPIQTHPSRAVEVSIPSARLERERKKT